MTDNKYRLPTGDYQLRKAAGRYWLLDMGQPGFPYRKPVVLNEGGAFIWQGYAGGMSAEEIAGEMSSRYKIPFKEARHDVTQFLDSLAACINK